MWDPADFARRAVAIDFETHLIQPGLLAPPIVCGATATTNPGTGAIEAFIHSADAMDATSIELICGDRILVGANIAFDFACLAAHHQHSKLIDAIFEKYDRGEIFDVLLAQGLDAIAHGLMRDGELIDPRGGKVCDPTTGKITTRYSLAVCVDQILGRKDAKRNDFWRKRYALLEHTPMIEWPEEALEYPKDDALNTLEVALAQVGAIPRHDGVRVGKNLHCMTTLARKAFGLHLASAWAMRTDPARVKPLRDQVDRVHAEAVERFTACGLIKADGKTDQNLLALKVAEAYGATGGCVECGGLGNVLSEAKSNQRKCKTCIGEDCFTCSGTGLVLGAKRVNCKTCDATGLNLNTAPGLPRTDKGAVQCSRDALKESGSDELADFGDISENTKLRGTYLPFIESGTRIPINLKANVLLATGRNSYEGLIQLLPREHGIREAFIPQDSHVLCSIDYAGIEMATLAQVCLNLVGYSRLAEALNAGMDTHSMFAATMLGISYDEFRKGLKTDAQYKDYRQAAKAANFGFPGGMGEPKFVLTKRMDGSNKTAGPDGRVYKGLRFCLLLNRAETCGVEKISEWKRRQVPPVCRACVNVAVELRANYFATWPEIKPYFDLVSRMGESIVVPGWNMMRGGCNFSAAANGGFQGLAAAGMAHALWRVVREMYCDRQSLCYGDRVLVAIHDELILSLRTLTAHESAMRAKDIMVEAMRAVVPDVAVGAEPALMRRWYKGAEPIFLNGRLIPWEPKGVNNA